MTDKQKQLVKEAYLLQLKINSTQQELIQLQNQFKNITYEIYDSLYPPKTKELHK